MHSAGHFTVGSIQFYFLRPWIPNKLIVAVRLSIVETIARAAHPGPPKHDFWAKAAA
jgi:hypothetical protein